MVYETIKSSCILVWFSAMGAPFPTHHVLTNSEEYHLPPPLGEDKHIELGKAGNEGNAGSDGE